MYKHGLIFYGVNFQVILITIIHKKVPLPERKRHTSRRVASTCCAVLVGGTPLS